MTVAVERDQIELMYEVPREEELTVLDELAERAGLRWTCKPKPEHPHPHPWTNHPDEPCGQCARTISEAAAFDARQAQ